MYAIIKTGGKQYRVQEGESLLVERLAAADGETVALQPLLFVDGSDVVDGDDLAGITVQARIVGHERGPKLRVVKFKPKRGYKRRTGHRQELTRIEIASLGRAGKRSRGRTAKATKAESEAPTPKPVAAASAADTGSETEAPAQASPKARSTTRRRSAGSADSTAKRKAAAKSEPAAAEQSSDAAEEQTTNEPEGTDGT